MNIVLYICISSFAFFSDMNLSWLFFYKKDYLYLHQASEELEERESLAQMAANADDSNADDGETYIGKICYLCYVNF